MDDRNKITITINGISEDSDNTHKTKEVHWRWNIIIKI